MASSVFITPGTFQNSGGTVSFGPAGVQATVDSTGTLTTFNNVVTNTVIIASTGQLNFLNRSRITAPAYQQLNIEASDAATGIGLDVSTDSLVKFRNRAQAAYGTVDVLATNASGTAGLATFGPAGVASVTVKGGIITAAS